MKNMLVLLFVVGLAGCASAQGDSVRLITNEMARENVFERSLTVGFAGTRSKQIERLSALIRIATPHELETLAATHENAIVRLYAYQALKIKKANIPSALRKQLREDKTEVSTTMGCILSKQEVGSLVDADLTIALGGIK